ncbi:hypothetical protein F4820DRAFT_463535 [Hypoxylon rubiginosum]|uniref:Uncharacterized protein n=1 Tax=Hypoxylon rubiginosum TaxID=110542 RepID=A0ACB9YT68_9PEZI|nr:hypothetical protein F4820DRAFT_463535 [Hypoxylon rubiginosum]
MTDKDLRLRLVVRRDGFPEERLVWNVSLENDPTVSKLLEKVNEVLPLELHDGDVFIRALERDDNRRRRISGRHQISTDGRHLIDGIPFGRRLLKTPSGRPIVNPPPRKRPRLAYDQEDGDDDFIEAPEGVSGSPSVRIDADFDDADGEDDNLDSDGGLDDVNMDADSESDSDDEDSLLLLSSDEDSQQFLSSDESSNGSDHEPSDEEDLNEELQDLARENAAAEEEAGLPTQGLTVPVSKGDISKVSALKSAFPSVSVGLCKSILICSDGDLKEAYSSLADGFAPALSESALLSLLDVEEREEHVPSKSNTSQDAGPPKDSHNKHAEESGHEELQDDDMQDDEDSSDGGDEEVSALVRKFDHRGFPPGSISSGKGLAHMAAISGSFVRSKLGGESETTSATLSGSKTSPEKTFDEDDTTSSDPSSSSSEDESSEAESDSDSDSSSDGSNNDDDDDDNSDSEDDDNEDINDTFGSQNQTAFDLGSQSDDNSDDSSGDSDDGPEESSTKPTAVGNSQRIAKGNRDHDDSNAETSGDNSTSSSEESSDSENEDNEERASSSRIEAVKLPVIQKSTKDVEQPKLPELPPNATDQAKLVPFGTGKETTKKRNARRRAAKKAKMLAKRAQDANESSLNEAQLPTPVSNEKALFEAKRQELLDAIASGGVEVNLSSPPGKPQDSSETPATSKRKRDEPNEFDQDDNQGNTPVETPASEDAQSSASTQKRRRIDVGAGRRLVFGALGLRNPKTKEDEIKLQAQLMEDVRPLQNPRLVQEENGNLPANLDEEPEEGLEAWRNKISYRAVECCYEGVQLSEPPFPFVQRWDPQQQSSWFQKKNKRGGQSKRAQRNQAHFYQDSRAGRKRTYDESTMWDEEGYDDTYSGIDDDTNNDDIELNYDDEEVGQPREANEASQFTDMDDLPSLPSDLSDLPDLRPGEVEVGMVITWQQCFMSSATNWQPLIFNVTGVVVRIDDEATGLEVCLAKRDRYLGRNKKKYDQNTGQRIYDRFEAPDLDDEGEEEDDGFRTIGFAEIQQPRILQQPLPVTTSEEPSRNADDPHEPSPGLNISQGEAEKQQTPEPEPSPIDTEGMEVDADFTRSSLPQDATREIMTDDEGSVVHHPRQEQQATDTSMSDSSHTSSPSRQLHESTSQAISASAISRERSTQDISSRDYFASDDTPDRLDTNISGSGLLSARQSSVPSFRDHEDEVVTGTPKVVKSKIADPPSSASSARSGRQPDYALDMENTIPDSFKITDDGADNTSAIGMEDQHDTGSDQDMSTPTPKRARMTELEIGRTEIGAENAKSLSPANPSTPSSLASLTTVWHTAVTSRNTQSQSTQSPSKSLPVTSQSSQIARTLKDKEYEEAMRRLDMFSDSQDSVSRIPDSFKHSSQPAINGTRGVSNAAMRASTNSPRIKMSPAPTTHKRGAPKRSSQFTIPPGSQVIELSSDSEPAYSEDYADDAMDGTYSPEPDSLPGSKEWAEKVRKMEKKRGPEERGARSVTAPIRAQLPKNKQQQFLSSSQGRLSSLSSSVSDFSQIKPRRKTSSRF